MDKRFETGVEPNAVEGRACPANVLFVEDDPADAFLISSALDKLPSVGAVTHAENGQYAMDLIDRGAVRPDVIFVDLSMPIKGGFSLMTELANSALRDVPVVVLTSSSSKADAQRSRLRRAIRVLVKPMSSKLLEQQLSEAIEAVYPQGLRRKAPDLAQQTVQ